jgi:hypothetical protein
LVAALARHQHQAVPALGKGLGDIIGYLSGSGVVGG